MKQKTLFKLSNFKSDFGGALLPGKRKTRRPLSYKNPTNIVLRADIEKSGSLLRSRVMIDNYFAMYAERFGVKIYEKAIVSNHIHLVALFSSRLQYMKFIRAISGTLACKLKIKWLLRPWTRILKWGRDLQTAIKYTLQNHFEAIGAIPYQKRKTKITLQI